MDDDQFLYGLRQAPKPEFAARLRARLRERDGHRFTLPRTWLKIAASVAVVVVTGSLVASQLTHTGTAPIPVAASGRVVPALERDIAAAPPGAGAVSPEISAFRGDRGESAPAPEPAQKAQTLRRVLPPEAAVAAAPPAKFAAPKPYAGFTPGTVFRECDTCPEMVVIPAGSFQMRGEEPNAPTYDVTFSKPFAMEKTEVTFAEWDACVTAGACTHNPTDQGWGRESRPVINVSWRDTQQYVAWLSQKTGATYRLPTRTEWDYAAHAGTTTRHPWGDEVGRNNANCRECGSQWDGKQTAPVASFAANPWGLHDLYGNAKEWVEDCLREKSFDPSSLRIAGRTGSDPTWTIGTSSCTTGDLRVVRGGGFLDGANNNQSLAAARNGDLPTYRKYDVGFRVVRVLD